MARGGPICSTVQSIDHATRNATGAIVTGGGLRRRQTGSLPGPAGSHRNRHVPTTAATRAVPELPSPSAHGSPAGAPSAQTACPSDEHSRCQEGRPPEVTACHLGLSWVPSPYHLRRGGQKVSLRRIPFSSPRFPLRTCPMYPMYPPAPWFWAVFSARPGHVGHVGYILCPMPRRRFRRIQGQRCSSPESPVGSPVSPGCTPSGRNSCE